MHDDLAKQLTQASARFYEEQGEAFSKTRHYTWHEEKIIAPLITSGMTVVDIGAGNGRFARTLTTASITYIGIEPSDRLRKTANPTLDMRPGALPHLPLADQIADFTLCFAVFHHIPSNRERRAAVDELIRITKPGGYIVASAWHLHPDNDKCTAIPNADPGDVWVGWNAEGQSAQRYVHLMQQGEWSSLWTNPALTIQRLGLFGKTDWTTDEQEARNWFVIANRI